MTWKLSSMGKVANDKKELTRNCMHSQQEVTALVRTVYEKGQILPAIEHIARKN